MTNALRPCNNCHTPTTERFKYNDALLPICLVCSMYAVHCVICNWQYIRTAQHKSHLCSVCLLKQEERQAAIDTLYVVQYDCKDYYCESEHICSIWSNEEHAKEQAGACALIHTDAYSNERKSLPHGKVIAVVMSRKDGYDT